jgi:agmatinase
MRTNMGYHELYTSPSNTFGGIQTPCEKADYIILGVPFDVTSTYRTGARFMPNAIRQASQNIETYSFRTRIDIENLHIHDLGDLHTTTDTTQTLQTLQKATQDILRTHKTPAIIGGEHTITYATTKALGKKAHQTAIISFDAHLDLRNQYSGLTMSHTTFMRRINEDVKPAKIIEIGTRAVCQEELQYAKKANIEYLTTNTIRQNPTTTANNIKQKLKNYNNTYITIDMDILDPAYTPAAQNPEPDGLETHHLLNILNTITDQRTIAFDTVEIAPQYDQGISAIQTARVIFETLSNIERSRKA